ncbi:uncharacterized protein synpo2a isoform X2 [Stigmatopora nigra]
MISGDYVCVTLQGGGPWGFTLEECQGDSDAPILLSKVEASGLASQAGVREGDRLVALNGEPCAGVALSQVCALLETSDGCLRLLIKRCRGKKDAFKMKEFQILTTQDGVETPQSNTRDPGVGGEPASPPPSTRNPLSYHGVVQGRAPPASASPGRGSGGVGGPGVNAGTPGTGGGPQQLPDSFSLAFQISSDDGTVAEEEQDSDSDPEKPNKHRARHARLRRSDSVSDKQLKEARSKCKRIALLLSASLPNPNNKGLLMFKKHRQRAKKYTLVSYGTGGDQHDHSTEEDEDEIGVFEFPLDNRDQSDSENRSRPVKSELTIRLENSLLDGERKQTGMECLPETKGKGAMMFAQRRQRMDDIAAEHEELRRHGIPVEGAKAEPDQAYMDVNVQQQYQEQQYFEQQQYQHQIQQQQQQYQQQMQIQQQQQYQQYQQQQYEQQQMYQHPHFSGDASIQPQNNESRSSLGNRTAKPFTVQNMAASPYSPALSATDQYSLVQGEQIASRDERISTPAIRSGLLDSKRRSLAAKPMFTFKEAPKMSPNPELLNLLNMSNKKSGFESGPEEDYLSLGAEACNFLQSSRSKHKNPPPVAPKPVIDTSSAPWSPQMEVTNQGMPSQHSENSPACAPTIAHAVDPAPANIKEPTSTVPPSGPSGPSSASAQQQTWPPLSQQQEGNLHARSSPMLEPGNGRIWDSTPVGQQQSTISHYPAQVPPQEPPMSQSSLQPQWATSQSTPSAPNTWTPQIQAPWDQAEQTPSHTQTTWCQPLEPAHSQRDPNWTQTPEAQVEQPGPNWGQPQEPIQHQVSWAQPPAVDSQPTWAPHESQTQAPWIQPESQPQPTWSQPANSVQQAQAPDKNWVSTQPQGPPSAMTWPSSQATWPETAQPPTSLNTWTPVPTQLQPSWSQQPAEHPQRPSNTWEGEPGPPQHQATWIQSDPPQPKPSWQNTLPQSAINERSPAQTPNNTWVPQPQQPPNTPPLAKPWNTQQKRVPQPSKPFPSGHSVPYPINPLATVLNPSSSSSAYEMPTVRGKGADMFAKRQSRMEKYVVDSETVQANMAGRSTSPAASLPSEWKYTPNVSGRSYSLPPLGQAPPTSYRSPTSSGRHPPPSRQPSSLEKTPKPLTPWEAASRHPLGLVDEAFSPRELQLNLSSTIRLAAQRKLVPDPPPQWTSGASLQKTATPWNWGVGNTTQRVGYGSLPRQWQPHRSATQLGPPSQGRRPPMQQSFYRSNYNWQQ